MMATEAHGQHAHPHGLPKRVRARAERRRLGMIFALTCTFMVVEFVGGVVSGSLALIADAGHMLTDSAALALSYVATWLVTRSATDKRTFGFRRAEILAAFINAMGLVALAVWIVVEAVERIGNPRQVWDTVLLGVAVAGLAVNLTGVLLLRGHAEGNMTVRSALWHIGGDLLGSLGAIVAALVIRFTGWTTIDPIIGIGIAVLIGAGGLRILYDSANMLLDTVPKELDAREVSEYLASYPSVRDICDLHIWGVSTTEAMLTAHLIVQEDVDRDSFLQELSHQLQDRFGLAHMTIQLENAPQASCAAEW